MFDWSEEVDALRCRETSVLREAREEAVREQRRWRSRELAITRVLDERGQIDDSLAAADGVSIRDLREKVETARAFDDLPEIAAAAAEGRLSDGQTREAVKVADAATDAEWSDRAQRMSPTQIAKEARRQRTPSVDDTRKRHDARFLRTWWTPDGGILEGRFALPDLQGAAFESMIRQITEKMTPAKGQAWETPDRRAADALIALVERWNGKASKADGVKPKVVVTVPVDGPAEVGDGILLGAEQVEQLRANATVEVAVVDEHGSVVSISRATHPVNPKVRQAILARDGRCRWPGCEVRWTLEVHHLIPRSQGGSDDFANLATVCAMHHRRLVPHGTWSLEGNPNRPDGLDLVRHPVRHQPGPPRCEGDSGAPGPNNRPHQQVRTSGPSG